MVSGTKFKHSRQSLRRLKKHDELLRLRQMRTRIRSLILRTIREETSGLKTLAEKRADYANRLESSLQALVGVFSAWDEVERISLFGSYARGRHDLGTDLDVVVLLRTEEPFLERLRRLYTSVPLSVDIDILCYTPEEWDHIRDTAWGRRIRREEVVVYEKNPAP